MARGCRRRGAAPWSPRSIADSMKTHLIATIILAAHSEAVDSMIWLAALSVRSFELIKFSGPGHSALWQWCRSWRRRWKCLPCYWLSRSSRSRWTSFQTRRVFSWRQQHSWPALSLSRVFWCSFCRKSCYLSLSSTNWIHCSFTTQLCAWLTHPVSLSRKTFVGCQRTDGCTWNADPNDKNRSTLQRLSFGQERAVRGPEHTHDTFAQVLSRPLMARFSENLAYPRPWILCKCRAVVSRRSAPPPQSLAGDCWSLYFLSTTQLTRGALS